jgi:tetratricopeptide (TPR) repeat protein
VLLGRLDHFELLRLLGRGAMGDVYLAHDTHLDCDVALKVLHEDLASDAAHRERLLGEARTLAKIDHSNIVGIIACGETAPEPPGFLWPDQPGPHPARVVYLAMRYVEGTDLSEAIAARRPRLDRAIDWAKQIARGLEAAHARAVVHRDLKPGNIRVTPEGELKIVDFGLASSRRKVVESLAPTLSLTREIIVGTVGYSAPEQAEEADHTDPRCDLFSLGAILYEMVTGRRPFEGNSVLEVLNAIATREPPPMSRYARGVPDELERIVGKLLQKDPKQRYQSAHEVLTDLERMPDARARRELPRQLGPVAIGVALVAVSIGAYEIVHWGCIASTPETVAVVDFENITGDPAMERLAKGLGLDLVTSLVQGCRVTVVTSTLRDAEGRPDRDPGRIRREYGARSVVLGSLHAESLPASGTALSLHVSVVRTSNKTTRWAGEWDESWNHVAALRRQMTEAVLKVFPPVPGVEASPIDAAPARPGMAEEAYLRGRALLAESDPVLRDSSISEFNSALDLDPGFGRAFAGRARAKLAAYLRDRDTTRLAPAEEDARRAAHTASSEIEGRIALARILRERGRTPESIDELRAVLRLNDRAAEAYTQLAVDYGKLGDMDRAREYFRQARELQPASPQAWRAYGRFLLLTAADFAGAEEAFRQEIKLLPDANRGYEGLALVYTRQCRYPEAIATYARLPKPGERSLDLAGNRGTAYFFNGNYDLALKDFLDAVSGSPEDGNWRINLGDCYAHIGRRDDALREYRLAQRYFERDMAADPEDRTGLSHHAKSLAKSGDLARAREEAARCAATNPWRDAEVAHDLAMTFAICGERERALAALDTLVNGRGFSPCLLRAEDEFVSLRGDRRFRSLVGGAKP